MPGRATDFKKTRWSLVLKAKGERTPSSDAALATLYETYRYPLYAFLRGRGHTPDGAEDLLQAFFLRLLEKGTLDYADPARGRFRSFLLASIENFAVNEYDRQRALKRNPGTPLLSLDVQTAEGQFRIEPPTHETPESVFDRRWAEALVHRALVRLREEMGSEKPDQFEMLKAHLTGGRAERGFAQTAAALGISEGAARVRALRMRRHFRELVYDEVAHTVSTPEEIENEIRHLLSALGGTTARA